MGDPRHIAFCLQALRPEKENPSKTDDIVFKNEVLSEKNWNE